MVADDRGRDLGGVLVLVHASGEESWLRLVG